MDTRTVRDLHTYNAWAMNRVLDCAADLTSEQLLAENDTPWGSIRNQLVHLLIVHERWLSWVDGSMTGEEAYAIPVDMDAFPDFQAVRAKWDELQAQTNRFLERMTLDDLERDLRAGDGVHAFSIQSGQVMVHIAIHSMQHRTETAMALTRLGKSPGDLDYIFYALEKDASPTV